MSVANLYSIKKCTYSRHVRDYGELEPVSVRAEHGLQVVCLGWGANRASHGESGIEEDFDGPSSNKAICACDEDLSG